MMAELCEELLCDESRIVVNRKEADMVHVPVMQEVEGRIESSV